MGEGITAGFCRSGAHKFWGLGVGVEGYVTVELGPLWMQQQQTNLVCCLSVLPFQCQPLF